ncbi:hypothetical protein OESDEN_12791 [Oesophagostomum dentatum]|uniref:Uncharacterized protein n=1 Tax=Oesophagostomum dentatum TaxID=61180 RepID=A0A0B1SU63_OESDE|nr:hypothetical protein OESDEN_12791 [Oesophagostomum dentatum]
MTSLAAPVVLVAGAALAMTVPVIALKELLEKRSKMNFKKHLGRRHVCRVNFGELDAPMKDAGAKKNAGAAQAAPGGGTKSAQQSPPPAYDDLFRPPPPYRTKMIIG